MATFEAKWVHGMFGCDPVLCLAGCCCNPCAWASTRSKYDGSNCLFNCCCVCPCISRSIIREGFGIKGNCVGDVCCTCFCAPCTYTQTAREVREPNRQREPFDPTKAVNVFNKGLCQFKCGGDCLLAFLCPCVASGLTRTKYDASNFLFNCLCIHPVVLRNIIREGYMIEGTCVQDILIGTFCACCSIHQAQQEVAARGPKVSAVANQVKTMV
eukprot:PhM_4_TR17802/c0_g1_i1/m.72479